MDAGLLGQEIPWWSALALRYEIFVRHIRAQFLRDEPRRDEVRLVGQVHLVQGDSVLGAPIHQERQPFPRLLVDAFSRSAGVKPTRQPLQSR